MGVVNQLKHAWNAFSGTSDPLRFDDSGANYGTRPYVNRLHIANDKSIISSIYTRLGIDVAALRIEHVRLDDDGNYLQPIKSKLNDCLSVEANIDQAARAFRQDVAMTLFDKGVVAIVAVDTTISPKVSGSWDVETMRVGEIVTWYPEHVRVLLYNEKTGLKEEVKLPKRQVAVVENPLYQVMNEPNGTLQRLIRKLALLDSVDEQTSSGKLDMIIQLPYVIKSEARREQAETRRKDIEMQLKGSKYGIAYTDGTEKITQLNRPAENNMLGQVESLTAQLYAQLGLTEAIFNGTASESEMLNYHIRTIKPILTAITEAMSRTFLTKTARTQGQSIRFYRDPFEHVALSDLAEVADKLTRNEVVTGNEMRGAIGMKPSKDPRADKLINKNIPDEKLDPDNPTTPEKESELQNGT